MDALRSVGLTRDTAGMCVVTVNDREAIRDNGDVISHYATLDWFAPAPVPDQGSEVINDACLAFVQAMPHPLPREIWNDLKPAVYAAMKRVLEARSAESAKGGS